MDGFINLNKPKEFTSHDVINVLKRSFRGTKIGHGGTLDPSATGVLPICLGKATKLQDYVMGQEKKYCAELLFGYDSPTLDKDGDYFICDKDFSLNVEKFMAVLENFKGQITQIPPMVSAIKKNGVPLYKLAQRGLEIEIESRQVIIHDIKVINIKSEAPFPVVTLEIVCSKGTYIRSLARDIGAALETKSIVSSLTRLSAGAFDLENAFTMEAIAAMVNEGDYSFLLPMDSLIEDLPRVVTKDMGDSIKVLSGNAISCSLHLNMGDTVKITDNNNVLALARVDENFEVKPFKILYAKRNRKAPLELWQDLDAVDVAGKSLAVALGNFDGVHLGHKYLLEHMALIAEQKNLKSVATTFCPHPRDYFSDDDYKYLQSQEAKIQHIAATGIDALFTMPFDNLIARMSPEEFVDEILIKTLKAKMVFVGYNFRFAENAKGDCEWLKKYAAEKGIEISILDKITYNDMEVSSSAIKESLESGDVRKANTLLGYNYSLKGEVVAGQQVGRTIGFPTANVAYLDSLVLPGIGVYTTWAKYRGKRHPSVTSIGVRPSIGNNLALTVETYILDDNPDLYGEVLEVIFLNRIRGEEKFADLDSLKAKIAEDAEIAQSFFTRRLDK